jgi:hypothetical protein
MPRSNDGGDAAVHDEQGRLDKIVPLQVKAPPKSSWEPTAVRRKPKQVNAMIARELKGSWEGFGEGAEVLRERSKWKWGEAKERLTQSSQRKRR